VILADDLGYGGPDWSSTKSKQLFDLQNDPSEQTDVANENPDIVARLNAAYDRINREVPLEKPKT
jgi:glutathionyl-hydroquinone reductase